MTQSQRKKCRLTQAIPEEAQTLDKDFISNMLKMLKETMDYLKKSRRTVCGEVRKISREMKSIKEQ